MNGTRTTIICVICRQAVSMPTSRAVVMTTCGSAECKQANKLGERNGFYGRQHTPEARQANSDKHRGVWITQPCGCGCGTDVSRPQHRWLMSKSGLLFVDKTHFFRWNQEDHHPLFRGGSFPYGPAWPAISAAIRERDQVCRRCGKTPEANGRALDVHHVKPFRVSQDNHPDNLVALCMVCHHSITHVEDIEYRRFPGRFTTCLECGREFERVGRSQRICGPECKRKRTRQWERRYLERHPDVRARRQANAKQWQQENKERVNANHRAGKARRRRAAELTLPLPLPD